MSVLKATSWGRTRGPKTLVGVQGGEVDVVLEPSLDAAADGYATENQRYLHVMLVDKNAGGNLEVKLYGYNHAFGKWAPLNSIGTSDHLSITAVNSSTVEGSQTADDRELMTFEIVGVDRVAFVGTTADVRCYAACSTF